MQETANTAPYVQKPIPTYEEIMKVMLARKAKEEGYNFRTKGMGNYRLDVVNELIKQIENLK